MSFDDSKGGKFTAIALPINIEAGKCCACNQLIPAGRPRMALFFNVLGPVPGEGWGCTVCGLWNDGAVSIVCEDCLKNGRTIQYFVKGLNKWERIHILTMGPLHAFDHFRSKHPEILYQPKTRMSRS